MAFEHGSCAIVSLFTAMIRNPALSVKYWVQLKAEVIK
jgi:hypothetical protein